MAKPPSLSIGFVTWRTPAAVLARFLGSLSAAIAVLQQGMDARAQVYAISNEGPLGAAAVARQVAGQVAGQPRTTWSGIQGHGNIGYGAAQNLAIRRTQADYHLIANPDVVLDPDALLEAVRHLEAHPALVMAAPQGYDAAGRYASLAKRSPTALALLLRALSVPVSGGFLGRRLGAYTYADRLPAGKPQPVALASGCFMLCRTAPLKAVGGFDERYFLYFEDFDLCRRLAPHGPIHELPTVRIRHDGGHTARRGIRRILHFSASALRYFHRHGWRLL